MSNLAKSRPNKPIAALARSVEPNRANTVLLCISGRMTLSLPTSASTKWRKLLGSFSNVKTLCVHCGLVEELSRCIRLDDGEHPLELLPKLQELTYPGSGIVNDAFTLFIDAR
jgi:hypothetical protein